jgi:hypothetical protein
VRLTQGSILYTGKYGKCHYIVLAGDFNSQLRKNQVPQVVGIYSEAVLNNNGKSLIDFASFNELEILNTFLLMKIFINTLGVKEDITQSLTSKKIAS